MISFDQIAQTIDDLSKATEGDLWMVVHPSMVWIVARAEAIRRGCPVGKHRRARGARGRKRALMRSWRSIRPYYGAPSSLEVIAQQNGLKLMVKR